MAPTQEDVELGLVQTANENPPGYPRFSALIALHPSFHICRRFAAVRARLLLLKQDKVAELELKLRKLDVEETNKLFLATAREDHNLARAEYHEKLDVALRDYDSFLSRHRIALEYDSAPARAIGNLQRWIRGHPCIVDEEIEYLYQTDDLISVGRLDDSTTAWLEKVVGDGLVALGPKLPGQGVYIFTSALFRAGIRTIVAILISTILLGPVIICNSISSLTARLGVISVATAMFVTIVATLTKATTVELIMAGTTFSTVMVVFISTN